MIVIVISSSTIKFESYDIMTVNNNLVSVVYSDMELRNLVEEFLAQQKGAFVFKNVCSYILYWAMEDGRVNTSKCELIKGFEMIESDKMRVKCILESFVRDGRITVSGDNFMKF